MTLQSSLTKLEMSSSRGAKSALCATMSSLSFALSVSFNSLLFWLPNGEHEYAEYSNLIASQRIDSTEFAVIGIL